MEAEAEVGDAAVGQRLLGRGQLALFDNALPVSGVEGVQQVEIDAVLLQALALDVQDAVEVARLLDLPHRHLGGQLDLLAVAALERLPQPGLARFSWYIQAVST